MLGPILFSVYTLLLEAIFKKHNLQYYLYADDTQLYADFTGNQDREASDAVDRNDRCIEEARQSIASQSPLNDTKTEAIVIETPNRVSQFTFNYTTSQRSDTLPTEACKTLVHALVTSRLDYSNAVLYINGVQMVHNSATRLIVRQLKRQHITPVLIELHWLPTRWRVQYKLLVLVFSALHGLALCYMSDLLTPYAPTRNFRSACAGNTALQTGGLRQTCFLGVRTGLISIVNC